MKKCLVTGGGGFLGLAIVRQLRDRGLEVRVLSRSRHPRVAELGAEFVPGNIADPATVNRAVAGCDTVFHVASKAGIFGPEEEFFLTNVVGTRNVLDACKNAGVSTMVYTSTPSVIYSRDIKVENIQEDVPYPREYEGAYARTKALAEELVLANNGENGLATTAIRPHLIYGPEDPNLIPRVVARAKEGKLFQVGDGTNKVDLTYIDNAAQAHLLAADHIAEAAGKVYFISDGSPVALWPWINDLLRQIGVKPLTRKISYKLTYALGAVLEDVNKLFRLKSEPKMTRFTAAQLATSHYFNISNARRDLHYTPQVSPEEGVRRLVTWIKDGGLERKS